MSRFTNNKTADDALSDAFAKKLHVDEKHYVHVDAMQVKKITGQFAQMTDYKHGTQSCKANHPTNVLDKAMKDVIPINPCSFLLKSKNHPRLLAPSILPFDCTIYRQRYNQHHRRDLRSEKLLQCRYAPWAPTTTTTTGTMLRSQMQHLTTPPATTTTSSRKKKNRPPRRGLGKRRRVDWAKMDDDDDDGGGKASKTGGLGVIIEEEDGKKEEEGEWEESRRVKRQRRG